MNNSKLDGLLAGLAERKVPDLPGSFSQDVLREIRLRDSRADELQPWLTRLLQSWLQPKTFALAVTAAVIFGAAVPITLKPDSTSLAVTSLDLNVFSSSAPNAPSGLLAKWP